VAAVSTVDNEAKLVDVKVDKDATPVETESTPL
jgi:hypothetical protein